MKIQGIKQISDTLTNLDESIDDEDFKQILFENLKSFFTTITLQDQLIGQSKNLKEINENISTFYRQLSTRTGRTDFSELFHCVIIILSFVAKDFADLQKLNFCKFISRPLIYQVVFEGIPFEQTLSVLSQLENFTDIFKKNGVPIKKILRYGLNGFLPFDELIAEEKRTSLFLQLEDEIKPSLKVMEQLREIIYTIFIVDSGEDSKHRNVTKECIDVFLV